MGLMTLNELAIAITELSPSEIEQVMELIYQQVDTDDYNDMLLAVGVDVSTWCKKKHPPAG